MTRGMFPDGGGSFNIGHVWFEVLSEVFDTEGNSTITTVQFNGGTESLLLSSQPGFEHASRTPFVQNSKRCVSCERIMYVFFVVPWDE